MEKYPYGSTIIPVGARVEISPHFDLWMRGARYGRIVKIIGSNAVVRMDHPEIRKLQKFPITDLKGI